MKIRIKHILQCYQSGMSIRSISPSLQISRNTVKRYIHIYEDMGIELERLLKMDEHHLHELFGTETDNESTGSAEYKYLQEHIPEYIKRLKSRGTTRRSLYEEYLRNRPQGYSYCSFCLYLRREREVKVPVGRIDHIAGDQMYVDFAGDKLYISDRNTGDKVPVEVFAAILPCSQIIYYELYHRKRKNILSRRVKMLSIILEVYQMP
ncbi:helix-turn-helix domain-containing protein [Phocaeicola massiliensis]|uniref:helix-turn-helix domain-containing protein n=1 Tax=Phocaeicola massiliensis TaxID=204516 RepID=UPI00319E2EC7